MKKLFSNIKESYHDIKHDVRRFFQKAKRAIDYAKFSWGNGDFDYGYLLEIIDFKLKRMSDERLCDLSVCSEKTLEEISYARKLIADYLEADFTKNERQELEAQYEQINDFVEMPNGNYLYKVAYLCRETGQLFKEGTPENSEIRAKFFELHNLEEERSRECREELFMFLSDHLEGWWI